MRRLGAAAFAVAAVLGRAHAGGIDEALSGTSWGETSATLVRSLGARATVLPKPLDFGDSYVDVVMRGVTVGGYPLIAYYQIDKITLGLKRVQLERPRHAVSPPVFRAVLAALKAAYGPPDMICGARPAWASGFQAAAEYAWARGDTVIRAIFRDTTLEAYSGCVAGPCGLTAQLLVRASAPRADAATCRGIAPIPGRSGR